MNMEFSNPFTGYNNLIRGAFDLGEKDGVITRDELFNPAAIRLNGESLDASFFNFETYPIWGSSLDAFVPGNKIGIDRNPAAVPKITWQTGYSRSRGPRSPAAADNRVIHLNGISVEFLEELPDGSMKLLIRWDDRNLGRNVRWCGDINLHEKIHLEKGVQMRIDHGLTPQKPTEPVRLNGENIFAEPSALILNNGSEITLNNKSRILLENRSSLILKEGSIISMKRGSRILVPDSCILVVEPGASITGKGRIYMGNESLVEAEGGSVQVRIRELRP